MVDAHFGATVYWDLMSNVFGRQGPDGKKLSIPIYVNFIPGWDNGAYDPGKKAIYLGQGLNSQAVDCLGHEFGHAFNDQTAHLAGPEGDGLNESDSDIWGAMARFYLEGFGFDTHSNKIPLTVFGNPWISQCTARNMVRPSRALTGSPDYWTPTLQVLGDVHKRGEPNNRAFRFLSDGASAFMADDSYSALLPAGMKGIGTQDAARIWFDAMVSWMPADTDYGLARIACLQAAQLRFGILSPQHQAVMNAYAGIGIGSVAPSYPSTVPLTQSKPNNTWQTASVLPSPAPPSYFGGPQRFVVSGVPGADSDWFVVTVNAGQRVTVGVYPRIFTLIPEESYQVEVFDSFHTSLGKAVSTRAVFNAVDTNADTGFGASQQLYFKVTRILGSGPSLYDLAIQYR
jgi:hypothetical protein